MWERPPQSALRPLPFLLTSVALALPITVLAEPPPDAPEMRVEDETPAGSFTVGAGYGTYEGFQLATALQHTRFFGVRGLQLDLNTHLSAFAFGSALSIAGTPELTDSPWFWKVGAYVDKRAIDPDLTLDETVFGGRARLGVMLGDGFSVSVGTRLEARNLNEADILADVPGLAGLLDTPIRNLGEAWVGFDYSTASDDSGVFLDGVVLTGRLGRTSGLLGSEFEFTRAQVGLSYGAPLPLGMHLHLDGRAGALRADDPSQIPLFERFRLGGPHALGGTVLTPTGPTAVLGGREIALGGHEAAVGRARITIPIVPSIGLHAFGGAEAGALRSELVGTPESDWNASGFGGLFWASPIGPMSFGLALPLTDGPNEDPMFTFSIGQAF